MKDDNFTMLASFLLGVLQLFTLFGFDLIAFIVESIAHSVHSRCPDCLIEFAGYYGQSVLYFVYTFSNLIAPCILHLLGIKKTFVAASVCFAIYCASFFHLRNYLYFPASILAGLGFALFYCGGGAYAAKHSTDRTFSRNQSITWMLASSSMVVCGIFMIFSAETVKGLGMEMESQSNITSSASYREYSDFEIRILAIGTLAVSVMGIILACLLPRREIKGSLFEKTEPVTSFRKQLGMVGWALKQKGMLKMVPFFLFTGFFTSFWLTIYPTTMTFTDSFAEYSNLVAYICMSLTAGELIIGFVISFMNKRIKDFGLAPCMGIACVVYAFTSFLILLYVPPESNLHPTKEISYMEPSFSMAIFIGVLCGVVDGAMHNVRMTAAAKAVPTQPAIAFCLTKFYQALSSTAFYYLSSMLNVYKLVSLMTVNLLIGLLLFMSFLKDLRRVYTVESIPEKTKTPCQP
ncbi:unnamed protein product, partial [Mesorhabditis belari]|uniref:Uncharacterized protein n=1 Tax=Mesorhabditis belari TaxID=2138241 RepID=A0AAF3FKS3_9BILA